MDSPELNALIGLISLAVMTGVIIGGTIIIPKTVYRVLSVIFEERNP